MARDGSFFGFAKRIQPKFHTPSGAVVFQGGVTVLLVLTGTTKSCIPTQYSQSGFS
jgi:amino acid transporter